MPEILSFSAALRERSSGSHSRSETAGFMSDLLKGEGSREDYIALVAQHYFIYDALEGAGERMRQDPVASVFLSDKLTRLPALEADLAFLLGPEWRERIAPLPTTQRYVERIRQVGATWAGGFVAHHYTRYLGDLSGGQAVAALVARHYGATEQQLAFARFPGLGSVVDAKRRYREELNAVPLDAHEVDELVREVRLAFAFNGAIFDELAA